MKILTLLNGPIAENCYVLSANGREALVIDPGSSPDELMAAIGAEGLKPVLLLATHAHFDHIGAVHALAQAYGAPFGMHALDEGMLEALEDSYMIYGMGRTKAPQLGLKLGDGALIEQAGIRLKVIHTPGHTPGGVCFYHQESGSLFSGDTLFQGSIGRSDFEGGNHAQLVSGIRAKLLSLPDETKVYPGHGDATTIGDEKRDNAFL